MKTLVQYINESRGGNYAPKFSVKDWEKALKEIEPTTANYSQIAGLDNEDVMDGNVSFEEWWESNQEYGDAVPENVKDVVEDIFNFIQDWYDNKFGHMGEYSTFTKAAEVDKDPVSWGVSEEDYTSFITPKKPLGQYKAYGVLLKKKATGPEFKRIVKTGKRGY